jgi:hypothetical protein
MRFKIIFQSIICMPSKGENRERDLISQSAKKAYLIFGEGGVSDFQNLGEIYEHDAHRSLVV